MLELQFTKLLAAVATNPCLIGRHDISFRCWFWDACTVCFYVQISCLIFSTATLEKTDEKLWRAVFVSNYSSFGQVDTSGCDCIQFFCIVEVVPTKLCHRKFVHELCCIKLWFVVLFSSRSISSSKCQAAEQRLDALLQKKP